MKVKGAKQVHYDSGPNMTPLVDVVMVILIFLMLAGSFGATEHYLISNVPVHKNAGGHSNQPVPDSTEVDVSVESGAPTAFNATVGDAACTSVADIKAKLTARLQELAQSRIDKVQIVIKPAGSVDYRYLVDVYQAAIEASGDLKASFPTPPSVSFEDAH